MPKVLFIGDPHLKINRFDLAKQFLAWLNSIILSERPDIVVNLGDTFDTHAVLRSEVLNEFIAHVDLVLENNIDYVYLVGNHDMYKPNDSRYHAMKPFKNRHPRLHIIDETKNLFNITFVPYQHDPALFPKNTLPVCVAHQTFLGADYGAIICKDGVEPQSIHGCEIVISGHIHKRQSLISSGQRDVQVLYVGTPFSQGAADVDQIKGITIFDMDTYKQKFIQSPLPSYRKINILLNESFGFNEACDVIASSISSSKDHWILEIDGAKPEILSLLNSKKYKEIIKDINIKVKTNFIDKEKKKIAIEVKTLDSIVTDYINKVYSGSLDKAILLKIAKDLLYQTN
jgi:DNA repair exonuclease SbcCD nuclease subunit